MTRLALLHPRQRAARLLFVVLCGACGLPENGAVTDLHVPDRAAFPTVADALQPSCGTLD